MNPKGVMVEDYPGKWQQGGPSLGKPDENYRVQSTKWEVRSGVKQSFDAGNMGPRGGEVSLRCLFHSPDLSQLY